MQRISFLFAPMFIIALASFAGASTPKGGSENVPLDMIQAGYDNPRFVELNGGLDATVMSMGRSKDHRQVTVTVRVHNGGKNTAYIALVGLPIATDNLGAQLNFGGNISGIARCNGDAGYCLGLQNRNYAFPLQNYTYIEPGRSANINFTLFSNNGQSDGPSISLSMDVMCRFVADQGQDETLSDATKLRQVRLMPISFPPMAVNDAH